MRETRKYGRPYEAPAMEAFRYRAIELGHDLRLCCRCLQGRRRCMDSRRNVHADRSWKAHRRTRWRTVPR